MNTNVILPPTRSMMVQDVSTNLKLASLNELTRSLEQCLTPDETSYPLGIEHSETFKQATVHLEPGDTLDTLLLYTDGVTEARDKHDDLFEQRRRRRVLQDAGDKPAEMIKRLRAAVQAHEHGRHACDDQSLVVARVL